MLLLINELSDFFFSQALYPRYACLHRRSRSPIGRTAPNYCTTVAFFTLAVCAFPGVFSWSGSPAFCTISFNAAALYVCCQLITASTATSYAPRVLPSSVRYFSSFGMPCSASAGSPTQPTIRLEYATVCLFFSVTQNVAKKVWTWMLYIRTEAPREVFAMLLVGILSLGWFLCRYCLLKLWWMQAQSLSSARSVH